MVRLGLDQTSSTPNITTHNKPLPPPHTTSPKPPPYNQSKASPDTTPLTKPTPTIPQPTTCALHPLPNPLSTPPTPLPAYDTKNHLTLTYPLPTTTLTLHQTDTSGTTGSTLWLSAQILTAYLTQLFTPRRAHGHLLELGSGIGLTSLALSQPSLGFTSVTATDTQDVCTHYLTPNISSNSNPLDATTISVIPLDWSTVQADVAAEPLLQRPFDVVVASDLVYEISLLPALCRTLGTFVGAKTTLYVAQEVRVESLFATFLQACEREGLSGGRVPHTRLQRVMQVLGWDDEAWEGVVVWKFKRKKSCRAGAS